MLAIHILNILKLLRNDKNFFEIFYNAIHNVKFKHNLDNYVLNSNLKSREYLWDFFSTEEHIIPTNTIIKYWRAKTVKPELIESSLEDVDELPFHFNLLGKVAETDNIPNTYKAMLENARKEKFFFHRVCIINTANKLKYLFY